MVYLDPGRCKNQVGKVGDSVREDVRRLDQDHGILETAADLVGIVAADTCEVPAVPGACYYRHVDMVIGVDLVDVVHAVNMAMAVLDWGTVVSTIDVVGIFGYVMVERSQIEEIP